MDLHLITAVHNNLTDWLDQTATSVAALRKTVATTDVKVHWHVVVDGPGRTPTQPDAATTYQTPGKGIGVSAARNLALAATGGTGWTFRLDGDDTIHVDGWQQLLDDPNFTTHDWHPTNLITTDGQHTAHWFPQQQPWAIREVEETWTSPMPFHPGNIVAKTELVLAAGGWPALRVNEDILLCFLINELATGLALPHVTLNYRKWNKQSTTPTTSPKKPQRST